MPEPIGSEARIAPVMTTLVEWIHGASNTLNSIGALDGRRGGAV